MANLSKGRKKAMVKYDVFISCKSEDYQFAEKVYNFLKSHDIHAFLASQELRRQRDSVYQRTIWKALEEADHIIVFASNPKYMESPWVEYEWRSFITLRLDDKKPGNILTILKGITVKDITKELLGYQSFQFEDYQNEIIKYVETPASIERSKKKRQEEEQRRKREEKAREARAEKLKSELIAKAEKYQQSVTALHIDICKIYSLLKKLGITSRKCPICDTVNLIKAKVCSTCGWPISPLEGLPDLEYLNGDSEDIRQKFADIYGEYLGFKQFSEASPVENERVAELESIIEHLKDEISALKKRAEVSSRAEPETPAPEEAYEVWVKRCPAKAEKIIAEYLPDFELRQFRANMRKRQPVRLATFSSESDSLDLKSRLEDMGAIAEINKTEKQSARQTILSSILDIMNQKSCLESLLGETKES